MLVEFFLNQTSMRFVLPQPIMVQFGERARRFEMVRDL